VAQTGRRKVREKKAIIGGVPPKASSSRPIGVFPKTLPFPGYLARKALRGLEAVG